jgi:protocatechuate 3,4-dioxygenase beta subunit
VLTRHPTLPPEVLQGDLALGREPTQTLVLGPQEALNPADLWSALENELRPAIHYRVILPLDVARRFTGPLVTTKLVRVQGGLEVGRGPFVEIRQIAGTVRDGQGRPVAGVEVTVKENGLRTTTDAAGHYTFSNLAPGSYTFIVTAPGHKAREQKVVVAPAAAGKTAVPYDLGI